MLCHLLHFHSSKFCPINHSISFAKFCECQQTNFITSINLYHCPTLARGSLLILIMELLHLHGYTQVNHQAVLLYLPIVMLGAGSQSVSLSLSPFKSCASPHPPSLVNPNQCRKQNMASIEPNLKELYYYPPDLGCRLVCSVALS